VLVVMMVSLWRGLRADAAPEAGEASSRGDAGAQTRPTSGG